MKEHVTSPAHLPPTWGGTSITVVLAYYYGLHSGVILLTPCEKLQWNSGCFQMEGSYHYPLPLVDVSVHAPSFNVFFQSLPAPRSGLQSREMHTEPTLGSQELGGQNDSRLGQKSDTTPGKDVPLPLVEL